ncbi:MAG: hypothetical protein ACRDJJ_08545, partial [Actinomycetota bacterium]
HRRVAEDLEIIEAQLHELMDARSAMALEPLKDVRRIRRAMKTDAIDRVSRRRIFTMGPGKE